jgi:hypothetical protein
LQDTRVLSRQAIHRCDRGRAAQRDACPRIKAYILCWDSVDREAGRTGMPSVAA